jgi:hypothetical protein
MLHACVRKIWCDGWKRKYFGLRGEVNKAPIPHNCTLPDSLSGSHRSDSRIPMLDDPSRLHPRRESVTRLRSHRRLRLRSPGVRHHSPPLLRVLAWNSSHRRLHLDLAPALPVPAWRPLHHRCRLPGVRHWRCQPRVFLLVWIWGWRVDCSSLAKEDRIWSDFLHSFSVERGHDFCFLFLDFFSHVFRCWNL